MRVLLLSAYDAASHRAWRQGLQTYLSDYHWTQLSLPDRYFNWRIRGNSLTWFLSEQQRLNQPYDLVIATSMVDLSSLRGMVPALARIPTLLYFHENQFAYPDKQQPVGQRVRQAIEPKVVNLYSAVCADRLVFNSDYNRDTFLSGVREFVRMMPDGIDGDLISQLQAKSQVLPVPIAPVGPLSESPLPSYQKGEPLQLVWPHRWEWDKGPDRLLALVRLLLCHPDRFRLRVIGQQFRQIPPPLNEIQRLCREANSDLLAQFGYLPSRDDYQQCLATSHVALSTTLHEFQGLSTWEAVAAGCVPLVPSRLAYPGYFSADYCYREGDADGEAHHIMERLIRWQNEGLPPRPDAKPMQWPQLANSYRDLFTAVAAG